MTAADLLASLQQRGVQLWLDGDRVRYKAAADALTPAVLAQLRERKAEIIELLRQHHAGGAPAQPLRPLPGSQEKRPLSFSQERLWFLDKLEPNRPVYNIPVAMRLTGPLDRPALQRSFDEILRRHESLRANFDTVDGNPVQRIRPPAAGQSELPVVDLSGQRDAESEALRLAGAEARRPFDLAREALLRPTLYRLGPAEHVLLVNLHHIVADGWSLEVLFRELRALYEAFLQEKPSPLPELPIQYADFAAWQRDWLRGDVLKDQLDYWRQRLANGRCQP